jgi:NADH:ubiquinone oxidoreductase subunit 3 (subunit A)
MLTESLPMIQEKQITKRRFNVKKKKPDPCGIEFSRPDEAVPSPNHFFFGAVFFVVFFAVFFVVPHFFAHAITSSPPQPFLMDVLNTLSLSFVKNFLAFLTLYYNLLTQTVPSRQTQMPLPTGTSSLSGKEESSEGAVHVVLEKGDE